LKCHVVELVDTDESDATSGDEESEEEEEYEQHTDGEEDDEEIVPNEILRVANAIEEKVVVAVVVDDRKVACDICGKKYKVKGLNTHKAVHKKK